MKVSNIQKKAYLATKNIYLSSEKVLLLFRYHIRLWWMKSPRANVVFGVFIGWLLTTITTVWINQIGFDRECKHGFAWLRTEMADNRDRLHANSTIINENRNNKYEKMVLASMPPMATESAYFIISHLGVRAFASGERFEQLARLYSQMKYLNYQLDHRSVYQVSRLGMSNYMMDMDTFDKYIETLIRHLRSDINDWITIESQR